MKSVMYCMFPYDNDGLYAIRTNDDGTFSMRTWLGRYDDEYGPQKNRFDLRQSKPYITTKDFNQLSKIIDRIKVDNIGNDLDSIGFSYGSYNQKMYVLRDFIQAGYNEDHLWVVTERNRDSEHIDCRVALINLKDREVMNPWKKEPEISPRGSWRWSMFDEHKLLNEDALTMLDRPATLKMAVDLFMEKWECKLADFKEWCGVTG